MNGVVLKQTGNVVEDTGVIEICHCQQKQAGKNRYTVGSRAGTQHCLCGCGSMWRCTKNLVIHSHPLNYGQDELYGSLVAKGKGGIVMDYV